MGPHGLSFNIEQTPTGGVNVTVQQAGGARGEVRVNGVSSEIPATTPRAMGNRGGAAGASRSSASPGTQPDLRQRHLCTVGLLVLDLMRPASVVGIGSIPTSTGVIAI